VRDSGHEEIAMHWKPGCWILIGVLFAALATTAEAQVATTPVTDTIYHADGTTATGTVIVSWPAFTTSSGQSIPTGSTSATIATGGALSMALVANAGSTPMGSYYTAVYHLDDGSVSRQYWVVPVSLIAVRIGAIESIVLPTSVAMQTVSKSYVDMAIATALTGHPLDSSPYVLKAGDSMTGPLILPTDPVSAMQAADKNYVDESVAGFTGGVGQKVSTLPLTTQIVAQPTETQLEVNNLNGVEYASQYVNGTGNNGIANTAASPACTSGCEIKAEQDYSGERFSTQSPNNQTHVKDARGGRQVDNYMNPLDVVGGSAQAVAQMVDNVSTQSPASLLAATGNSVPAAIALSITQEGLAGGSNLFPEQIESPGPYFKMQYTALDVKGVYNTQGQHGLVGNEIDCYGVGDCLMGARFLYASGGQRDSADEGAHPFDVLTTEDPKVYVGTCASGCTAGATTVMTTATAYGGTQGDGRFLIDTNPAKTITSATTGGAIVSGTSSGPHASAQFSGTSLPVSVFLSIGQVIPSQATNMAPGTVTFPIATSGVPSGYATTTAAIGAASGLACIVDQTAAEAPDNYEMAPYTIVDATHLQMILNKPHQILASLAFGGMCGYGLEQTVDTANGIRQLFPVLGSTSATSLYYAGANTPVVGSLNSTSGFLNLNESIASATRTANVVSVIATGNLAANVNGLSVKVAGVADSSYNGSFVVTTTGPNSFTYAQTGANSSSSGGTASVLTGGFAFYPMAEVLSVFDQATKSVDGQMTLAPNNVAWAPSDPVEEPHYYQEAVGGDTQGIAQSVPRPTIATTSGIQYQANNGPGLTGWTIANGSPASNYLGYGGTHGFPSAAYQATGIWLRTMSLTAGEQAVFGIGCNLHGCGNWNSSYNLFELGSSVGTDTIAFAPQSSTLTMAFRGQPYSFSPTAFTAGTINVGTLNASTISGVPTLDASGRVVPGGSSYGGVIGNDEYYNDGPAIYSNGHQVVDFYSDGSGGAQETIGDPYGSSAEGASLNLKGAYNCPWGSFSSNSGDGVVNKNAGGCNNPMASLMLANSSGVIEDFEPDMHAKLHDFAGNVLVSPMTFTGGASASNCGAGASFDNGSNDGAGRIVVGSSPPGVCKVNWMRAYVNVGGAWAVAAPHCSVSNEGQRASANITLSSNPSNGDTITIEGVTLTFLTTLSSPYQVQIGASAAATATNLYSYLLNNFGSATPGAAPGADPALVHYMYSNPSSGVLNLVYTYLDGVTGNGVALSTSDAARISLPATLSGGALPSTRYVIAQSGTGGMVVSAPGGALSSGDVLSYTCTAYW
jgi:hypothetical protein